MAENWKKRAEDAEAIVETDKHIKADLWKKYRAAEAEVNKLRTTWIPPEDDETNDG